MEGSGEKSGPRRSEDELRESERSEDAGRENIFNIFSGCEDFPIESSESSDSKTMIDKKILQSAKKIYSRSSGPGGQNVNKRDTKVTLLFDIDATHFFPDQKHLLLKKFPSGLIRVISQETRSQHRNEEFAFQKLERVIEKALTPEKKRKKKTPYFKTKRGKEQKARNARWLEYKKSKAL